jgi:hypothetical protein
MEPSTHSSAVEKLNQAKAQYERLHQASQNPHADPLLKSLQLAISRLEKAAAQHQS